MEATEIIRCRGHPLVSAIHPTTFEITTDGNLTTHGHCIIGVYSDKGAAGLSAEFKRVLCDDGARLLTTLACGDILVTISSRGSAAMTLTHPTDLVWRKSTFVCGRTIGICSDHVAISLPRDLVSHLRGGEELTVTMTAMRPG
ncbi:MAG: hypothetical protein A4E35_01172 [Methanoregula sp. PtaU1.Bin051]|nr:MAG: hypothetical protein A4E35_01172 [Methanoregula sp. PtaU1.Bin051]